MTIYIARGGVIFGPYNETQLSEYLAQGIFNGEELACHEGASEWQPLSGIISNSRANEMHTTVIQTESSRPVCRGGMAKIALVAITVCVLGGAAILFRTIEGRTQAITKTSVGENGVSTGRNGKVATKATDGPVGSSDVAKEHSIEWYEKAAAQGNADAQEHLGSIYFTKDQAKAAEWYQKAVTQGSAGAQFWIGTMYDQGQGVPRDAAKAVEWLQKAATQGHLRAAGVLGDMYEGGRRGLPRDGAKAVEWYQKAAAQGDEWPQFLLGRMYQEGRGVPKDATKAIEWYQKSAAQGGNGALRLGIIYEEGNGVPKNEAKAVEWYQKAASPYVKDGHAVGQGSAWAQYKLGLMYEEGRGVAKDPVKAVEWYQKSAEQGNAESQFLLGIMYSNGTGVPKNSVRAYAWVNLAATKLPGAIQERNTMESRLTGVQRAEAEKLSAELFERLRNK